VIRYSDRIEGVTPNDLSGFFVGWPSPPDPETHLEILRRSAHMVLAIDDSSGAVVGFITAISDGVLSAYIPLLEVLPDNRGQGIGRELLRRMLEKLESCYMVDLLCDPEVSGFYESLGMKSAHAMAVRRYDRQSGRRRS
jgi:ribosomal protein S18 acetylase RimI-like enzyme